MTRNKFKLKLIKMTHVSRSSRICANTLGTKISRRIISTINTHKITKLAYLKISSRTNKTGCMLSWWMWCPPGEMTVSSWPTNPEVWFKIDSVLFDVNEEEWLLRPWIAWCFSIAFWIDSIINSPATHKQSMTTKTTTEIWNSCERRNFWVLPTQELGFRIEMLVVMDSKEPVLRSKRASATSLSGSVWLDGWYLPLMIQKIPWSQNLGLENKNFFCVLPLNVLHLSFFLVLKSNCYSINQYL